MNKKNYSLLIALLFISFNENTVYVKFLGQRLQFLSRILLMSQVIFLKIGLYLVGGIRYLLSTLNYSIFLSNDWSKVQF